MADLTGAVGIANRSTRAQGSQPPSPVGDVGKRKQLALLLLRTALAVGIAMQLPIAYGTEACILRAVNYSLRSEGDQGRRSLLTKE